MNKRYYIQTATVFIAGLSFIAACDKSKPAPQSATTTATASDEEKACEAHGLPDAKCPFCHWELVVAGGPCVEHDVPEALCWICQPQLKKIYEDTNDWCGGHDSPESLCFICNPEEEAKYVEIMRPASQAPPDDAPIKLVTDPDVPRFQRPPSVTCATSQTLVRFASAQVARSAGLDFVTISERPVSRTLKCNAEIDYDQRRFARVASRVAGVVHSVERDVGDRVVPGDTLALVDSVDLASARAEYLRAAATLELWDQNHERTHKLVEQGIAGAAEDLEAENKLAEGRIALSSAEQKLRTLGLSDDQIAKLRTEGDTNPLLAIRAPFAGEVVDRSAVMGEVVDTTRPLFSVADTAKMWAMLDVYESDIAQVRVGQSVVVTVDGLRGESFGGVLTWISRRIDPQTRTLKVRVELDNSEGLLRANMYGRAIITIYDRQPLIVVPKSAVQWDGCCNIAFVQRSDLLYEPRQLRLGFEADDYYEVKVGLSPGDTVVTQGSFLLKTEIMKGSIGAGCCEHGPSKS